MSISSCIRARIAPLAGILFGVGVAFPAPAQQTTAVPPGPPPASGTISANSHWLRDPHSGCWVFYRWDIDIITDLSWSGQCTDSRASGPGTLTITRARQTETFTGNFVNGQIDGPGSLTTSDGVRLAGNFLLGALNGSGTGIWPSGQHYEGSFNAQRFSGKGKLTFPGGDTYEGRFLNGPASGDGKLVYTDGWQFRGSFAYGNPAGDVIVYRPDSSRVEGDFALPTPGSNVGPAIAPGLLKTGEHARTEFRYTVTTDGTTRDVVPITLSGIPEIDKAASDAIAAWHFKPATVNGVSIEYKPSVGFTFSRGTRDWRDGGHYEGQFINGAFDGQGSITWSGGDKYIGAFSQGIESGHGTFTAANGEVLEGNFKGGVVVGHAVLRRPNAPPLEGEFVAPVIDPSVPMPEVQYPTTAIRQYRQGTVTLRYRVETNGTIGNVRIIGFSGTQELDDEAVAEVFRTKMIPGTCNGKPVALDAVRKVVFQLQ